MLHVTCPLDVSQFSHIGNFESHDKICSKIHANVSGRQHQHFLSPRHANESRNMLLACHSTVYPPWETRRIPARIQCASHIFAPCYNFTKFERSQFDVSLGFMSITGTQGLWAAPIKSQYFLIKPKAQSLLKALLETSVNSEKTPSKALN